MWELATGLDRPSGINDGGVGLHHNSSPYLEAVRSMQLCDQPVATWPAPSGTELASGSDQNGPVGMSDPLARELWFRDDLETLTSGDITTPDEALDLSVVRIHEPVHAGLSDWFTHYYGQSRTLSFNAPLKMINEGPHVSYGIFVEEHLLTVLEEAWQIIQSSEWVQEAAALRAQRRFLDQFTHRGRDSGWRELPERVGYHRFVDRALDTGTVPRDNEDVPNPEVIVPHAIGDWLGEQVQSQPWTIDPLEVAFGFGRYPSWDDRVVYALPNSVLAAAARCPDEEVAQSGPHGQLQLLVDSVEEMTGHSYDAILTEAVPGGDIPKQYDTITVDGWFDHWRQNNLRGAVEQRAWYAIPLYSSSYPGIDGSVKATLPELLDGLVTDTVEVDGEVIRRLWLNSQFAWARGTTLLQLATQLWKLRDYTVLPLIREYMRSATIDTDQELEVARAVVDGTKLPDRRTYSELQNLEQLEERARRVHERTPELRERLDTLLQALKELGRAIYREDTDAVASFYR